LILSYIHIHGNTIYVIIHKLMSNFFS